MPRFSARSTRRLASCDVALQTLFNAVITAFDCTVLEGYRDQETQEAAYAAGVSKLTWPQSRHNLTPSRAVDVVPYPVRWDDIERFHYFGGFVLGVAHALGTKIRWGGDWDGDTETQDERFRDLGHFELAGRED